MSPCEIAPDVPVYISDSLETLLQAIPTTEKVVVDKFTYVLPVGLPLVWRTKVDTCDDSAVVAIYSARTSPGYAEDVPSVMTTPNDELYKQIGRSEQVIDRVRYTAMDPVPAI